MANLKEWLEEAESFYGERVEAMVVGAHYDRSYDDKALPDEHIVLSREDGLSKIDEEFDNGYGGADCFPFYAWTKTRVFFVHEYDGATGLNWAPRSPMAVQPSFGGNDLLMDHVRQIALQRS